MSILKSHNITLTRGAITLRPLCDDHLPLLYQWNRDPEVLYWCEGADVQENDAETVHDIYGRTSQSAFCFLVEFDGKPIGECWLQHMNIPEVKAMYADDIDVRRIDMAIFEKDHWNRGIGTQLIGMLVSFAFGDEHADVLHVMVGNYNERSIRTFNKNGFVEVARMPTNFAAKQSEEIHLALTRQNHFNA